jgi:hypothetical protein
MGYIALSLSSFPAAFSQPCPKCRSRPAANRFCVRLPLRPPPNVINIILFPYDETRPTKSPNHFFFAFHSAHHAIKNVPPFRLILGVGICESTSVEYIDVGLIGLIGVKGAVGFCATVLGTGEEGARAAGALWREE